MRTCRVPGCGRPTKSRFANLCEYHKLAALRTQKATEIDQGLRQDNVYTAISNAFDGAMANAKSPTEIAGAVRAAVTATAGPRGSMGVPLAQADQYVVQKLATVVSEAKDTATLDAVIGVLEAPRTDADGKTKLPPLGNSVANATKVAAIVQQATAQRDKLRDDQTRADILKHDTEVLSGEKGRLATLGDLTFSKAGGGSETVKAGARQDAAVRDFITRQSPATAREQRESPQQTFDRELSAFANGGVDHPTWKATLEAAPKGASLNELTNPAKLKEFTQAANIYDQLREKNPLYLQGLADKQTRDFFEAYRVAKTLPSASGKGTMTMEEAADTARRAAIDPKDDATLAGHFKTIEQQVSSADPTSTWNRVFGYEASPKNTGYLMNLVTERAKLFARLGLPPDQAITQAQTAVKGSTVNVNGWIVPTMGRQLPADFPKAATEYMTAFSKQYGELNHMKPGDISDVGLAYDGAGTFTLVNGNGMPLLRDGSLAHFTLKDLGLFRQQQDDKLRTELMEKAQAQRQQAETAPADGGGITNMIVRKALDAYRGIKSAIVGDAKANTADEPLMGYLGSGKDPSHITGMGAPLKSGLTSMIADMPPALRKDLTIASGFRSNERQAQLFADAVDKHGSEAAARRWVAPPGHSQHNHGNAADLGFGSPAVQEWVHANAQRYGLTFPMGHEPWHIEPIGARQ